jgi:predicted RNA-binding Zn-ribbon protein involved in translation (DUF1610 family)
MPRPLLPMGSKRKHDEILYALNRKRRVRARKYTAAPAAATADSHAHTHTPAPVPPAAVKQNTAAAAAVPPDVHEHEREAGSDHVEAPHVQFRGIARPFFAQQRACNRKRFEYKSAGRRARATNLEARRERRQRFGGTTKDPLSCNPTSFRDTALCDVMHYFDTRLSRWDKRQAAVASTTTTADRGELLARWGMFCCAHTDDIQSSPTTSMTESGVGGGAGGGGYAARCVVTDYFAPQPTGHEVHRRLIRQCRQEVWGEIVHEPVSALTAEVVGLHGGHVLTFTDGTCRSCNKPGMTRTRFEWVCGHCGDTTAYADAKDRHFKETEQCNPPSTGYERKNHLNEWLARIQASERKMIPTSVIQGVQQKFDRWGVSPSCATYRTVRQFLKDDGEQRFFEHIPQIIGFLTQKRPAPIPETKLKRIRGIFKELQSPFDEHKPKGRKNFLSYSFVLYKIFELLDLDEYLPYFPMLKSRSNLIKADILWRRLCGDCNYEFIPTV